MGGRGRKRGCVPEIGLPFPAPFPKFQEKFSDVGGGGGAGVWQGPKCPPPPV